MTASTTPTVLTRPTTACPRCNGSRIAHVGIDAESAFVWRECEECRHLWPLPNEWTPQDEARTFGGSA